MFLVIINTILDSIYSVLYKKALSISDIKPTVFHFIGELMAIPIIIVIIFYGFNFQLFLNPIIIGCFALATFLFIISNNIGQFLYKNEKLSTLIPYFKINNFIIVILGFLFFRDSSLLSFFICIGAVILTTIFSIDYKKHELPGNFSKIILHEVVKAMEVIVEIYILKQITNIEYVVLYQVIYIIFTFIVILYKRELSEFSKFKGGVVKYKVIGYYIGYGTYFIEVFLLKEYGIIITTLLGFFGSSLSIVIAYFFLKEKATKKEIILGVVTIILAGIGYYFR